VSTGAAAVAPPSLSDALGGFCEFPAVAPAARGRPYRYVYCMSAARPTIMGNALSKVDLHTRNVITWHKPGGAVGELQRRACS
jgi:carotenoid cleavage dioxygenase-like enzyme